MGRKKKMLAKVARAEPEKQEDFILADILKYLGMEQPRARKFMLSLGLRTSKMAWSYLYSQGRLPTLLGQERFNVLYQELMDG